MKLKIEGVEVVIDWGNRSVVVKDGARPSAPPTLEEKKPGFPTMCMESSPLGLYCELDEGHKGEHEAPSCGHAWEQS